MDARTEFGPRLRRERERMNLSLAGLAEASGVSRTYLIRLETRRETNPSLDVLLRLAQALDVGVTDLIGDGRVVVTYEPGRVSASLRRFSDEQPLPTRELEMLASIQWRAGEEPVTSARWRYVLDSLRVSKRLDEGG